MTLCDVLRQKPPEKSDAAFGRWRQVGGGTDGEVVGVADISDHHSHFKDRTLKLASITHRPLGSLAGRSAPLILPNQFSQFEI